MSDEHDGRDSFEDRLGARMRAATEGLEPSVDLHPLGVEPTASTRRVGVLAAAALVAIAGVAGVLVWTADSRDGTGPVATQNDDAPPSSPLESVSLPETRPLDTIPADSSPASVLDTAPPETTSPLPRAQGAAQNFLIVGVDNHACIDPDSPYAPALEGREGFGERSDTIMVLRVDPGLRRVAVLSFPRDLWVGISGRGSKNRINSAYVRDDPTRLIQTIVENFGVGIDHFVQLDFCAFKTLVDAVGGVAVPFDRPVRDVHTGLFVREARCFVFDGDHALAYVRSRHLEHLDDRGVWREDPGSDLSRIARQQDFLNRTLDSALAAGLTDVSLVRGLLDILSSYIVVDSGLTPSKMLEFLGTLADLDQASIAGYVIESTPQNISGNAVLIPRITSEAMQDVLAMFRGVRELGPPPEATEGSAGPSPPSSDAPETTIVPSPTVSC